MALTVGMRIGPYEVIARIGEGGMGEVYRARDTNLGRQVAIKVLPEAVATDAERLARFQREAELLARLNHPNIAQIYELEKTHGTTALVMELVEGPTLADRVAQGPLDIDEALPLAHQITEALEAAHELGVIHRDLKPANIKIRSDGTVKVLDFGLAKALEPALGSAPTLLANSPTLSGQAMITGSGVILGTAAYMSPEQAQGKPADKRSDIWAFGCVFFEMLTGTRAFESDDVTDTLAAIVRGEPDWSRLPGPPSTALERALRLCLQKDARRRLRDIGDVRLALEGAFDSPRASAQPASATIAPEPKRSSLAVPVLVGALLLAAGAAVWSVMRPAPAASAPVRRYALSLLPPAIDGAAVQMRGLALSPDGTRLVYAANADGKYRLFLRSLDQLDSRPLRIRRRGGSRSFLQMATGSRSSTRAS